MQPWRSPLWPVSPASLTPTDPRESSVDTPRTSHAPLPSRTPTLLRSPTALSRHASMGSGACASPLVRRAPRVDPLRAVGVGRAEGLFVWRPLAPLPLVFSTVLAQPQTPGVAAGRYVGVVVLWMVGAACSCAVLANVRRRPPPERLLPGLQALREAPKPYTAVERAALWTAMLGSPIALVAWSWVLTRAAIDNNVPLSTGARFGLATFIGLDQSLTFVLLNAPDDTWRAAMALGAALGMALLAQTDRHTLAQLGGALALLVVANGASAIGAWQCVAHIAQLEHAAKRRLQRALAIPPASEATWSSSSEVALVDIAEDDAPFERLYAQLQDAQQRL